MYYFDDVDIIRTQSAPMSELWAFLPVGYLFTILIETPVLLIGLPKGVSLRKRLWCGIWLTACTYPIVILVLPGIFFGSSRGLYLLVAETFAPVAECVLFWLAYRNRGLLNSRRWIQSFIAITVANLASFALGEIMNNTGWFGWF